MSYEHIIVIFVFGLRLTDNKAWTIVTEVWEYLFVYHINITWYIARLCHCPN